MYPEAVVGAKAKFNGYLFEFLTSKLAVTFNAKIIYTVKPVAVF
jgi:hypothetical protein